MMNRTNLFLALLAAGSSLVSTGCLMPSEEQLATGAAASALQSSRNASHTQYMAEGAKKGACATPEALALGFAAQPNIGLYPPSCATKTADGPVVHVKYDDCTGAFGQEHLNGGLDTTFETGDACDDLKATVKDTGDLTGNGRPIDYSANADIRLEGDQNDIAYKAEWSAGTWAGEAKGKDDLTVVQDVSTYCLNVGGHSKATVAGYEFDSELKGIEVCPDECPKAGTLEIQAKNGFGDAKITITFDGTDTAHAVGGHGRKFDIHLVCAGS